MRQLATTRANLRYIRIWAPAAERHGRVGPPSSGNTVGSRPRPQLRTQPLDLPQAAVEPIPTRENALATNSLSVHHLSVCLLH